MNKDSKHKKVIVIIWVLIIGLILCKLPGIKAIVQLFSSDTITFMIGGIRDLTVEATPAERFRIATACFFAIPIPDALSENVTSALGIRSSSGVEALFSYPDEFPFLIIHDSRALPFMFIEYDDGGESGVVSWIAFGKMEERLIEHLKSAM